MPFDSLFYAVGKNQSHNTVELATLPRGMPAHSKTPKAPSNPHRILNKTSQIHSGCLLGAIVEGPGGNLFIKFTGPAPKTIAANQKKFTSLLNSVEKE